MINNQNTEKESHVQSLYDLYIKTEKTTVSFNKQGLLWRDFTEEYSYKERKYIIENIFVQYLSLFLNNKEVSTIIFDSLYKGYYKSYKKSTRKYLCKAIMLSIHWDEWIQTILDKDKNWVDTEYSDSVIQNANDELRWYFNPVSKNYFNEEAEYFLLSEIFKNRITDKLVWICLFKVTNKIHLSMDDISV